jgi:YVTN family beta-propeller protein
MKLRICGLLAVAALAVAGILGSAQALAQNAYITNVLDNTVSAIDTTTNTVSATIRVGITPVGAAVSPDGSKVYVKNQFSNTVSVIATATNAVTATIPVGAVPTGVALSSDGSKVY